MLRAVADRDAYANLLLPSLLTERGITGRDAAFATELTYGTLRGQGTYDAIIAACSDRDQLDQPVRDVLRLGAHQLLATRIGSHAAVATSVDLAKDVCGPRPSGFVNAVLRRVASRDLDAWITLVAPDRSQDETGHLSIRHSYPRWIVDSFREALANPPLPPPAPLPPLPPAEPPAPADPRPTAEAPSELDQALAAGNVRPEVVLTLLPPPPLSPTSSVSMAPSILLERVDGAIETLRGAERTRWSPFGVRLTGGGDPAALIATGRAAAQDEASQLAALALSQVPLTGSDHLWLDVCAGPGGKARLLAYLAAERDARLVAGELRPHRAKRVREALQRAPQPTPTSALATATATGAVTTTRATTAGTVRAATTTDVTSGAAGAGVVVADARQAPWRAAAFDRVLADVPCSGLGSLRRRPEARWRKSPADIPELAALQRELLDSAIDSARPGGVVAYVTCSPHLAETYDVVTAVLGSRTDVSVLDAPAILAEAVPAGIPALPTPRDTRFAQFWPHRHGTDAIFLALLRRE